MKQLTDPQTPSYFESMPPFFFLLLLRSSLQANSSPGNCCISIALVINHKNGLLFSLLEVALYIVKAFEQWEMQQIKKPSQFCVR